MDFVYPQNPLPASTQSPSRCLIKVLGCVRYQSRLSRINAMASAALSYTSINTQIFFPHLFRTRGRLLLTCLPVRPREYLLTGTGRWLKRAPQLRFDDGQVWTGRCSAPDGRACLYPASLQPAPAAVNSRSGTLSPDLGGLNPKRP